MSQLRNIVAEIARQKKYQRLCALMEPMAIEPYQFNSFTYNVAANDFRMLIASFYTNLGSGTGRSENRNPANGALDLVGGPSGITLSGLATGAGAIILNPNLPVYGDPESLYYQRMSALDGIDYQNIKGSNTSTSSIVDVDWVPGPYGALVRQVTCFDNVYVITRLGTGDGINWENEIGDSTGNSQRYGDTIMVPISRSVVSTFGIGVAATTPPVTPNGSFQYQLLPRTWSKIPDPIQPVFSSYLFYDDFPGASLDTTTNWNTPTVSTAGNIAVVPAFQCLKLIGNTNWGTNGVRGKITAARSSQPTIVMDVMLSPNTATPSIAVGWNKNSGVNYTDLAHGLLFTKATDNITAYEDGVSRGVVGNGMTRGFPYRISIKALSGGGATYGIQGGTPTEAYNAIGAATFTDITPGTSSSADATLTPGMAVYDGTCYVNIVRTF